MQSAVFLWLPFASGIFCDLPQGNKLRSKVSKGKQLDKMSTCT